MAPHVSCATRSLISFKSNLSAVNLRWFMVSDLFSTILHWSVVSQLLQNAPWTRLERSNRHSTVRPLIKWHYFVSRSSWMICKLCLVDRRPGSVRAVPESSRRDRLILEPGRRRGSLRELFSFHEITLKYIITQLTRDSRSNYKWSTIRGENHWAVTGMELDFQREKVTIWFIADDQMVLTDKFGGRNVNSNGEVNGSADGTGIILCWEFNYESGGEYRW